MNMFKGFNLDDYQSPEKAQALIQLLDIENVVYSEEEKLIRQMENKPLSILEEENPSDYVFHDVRDKEYTILTDEEADEAFDDYFENGDFRDYWVEAVKSGSTDSSLSDFIENYKNNSSRGEILAYYDGREDDETVNGTTYYIYRR